MSEEIINRVAQSGLLTLDLEEYYPREGIVVFDLKPLLFREMILKEKEFRAGLDDIDWTRYTGKILAVTCTADAIIPAWAYMLIAVHAQPFTRNIVLGDPQAALEQTFLDNLQKIDLDPFTDKRVMVKGCGDLALGPFAYLGITRLLQPVVKSILYGEA